VSLTRAINLTVGTADSGNTISRNAAWGIYATGSLTGVRIMNNTIDANGKGGVWLNAATGLALGGTTVDSGNRVINSTAWRSYSVGIQANGISTGTRIRGNTVIGHSGSGVVLKDARGITVGGASPSAGNVIQSNLGNGLLASGICTGSVVQGNTMSGNRLGNLNTRSARQLTVR
jgi:parallel beta-helix repeat protein